MCHVLVDCDWMSPVQMCIPKVIVVATVVERWKCVEKEQSSIFNCASRNKFVTGIVWWSLDAAGMFSHTSLRFSGVSAKIRANTQNASRPLEGMLNGVPVCSGDACSTPHHMQMKIKMQYSSAVEHQFCVAQGRLIVGLSLWFTLVKWCAVYVPQK